MRKLIGEKIGSVKSRAEYSILPDRVSDKIVFRITQFEDRRFQSMLCFVELNERLCHKVFRLPKY